MATYNAVQTFGKKKVRPVQCISLYINIDIFVYRLLLQLPIAVRARAS